MEGIDPKYLDVEPLQVTEDIVRFHGMNPGGSCMNGNNNFLIGTGKARILLDCGACMWSEEQSEKFVKSVVDYLQENELTLSHILVTHHHYDHLGNVPPLVEELQNLGHDTSMLIVAKRLHDIDFENNILDKVRDKCQVKNLEDDEVVKGETNTIEAMFTPGHCDDHMCFILHPRTEEDPHIIFSGDCVLGFPSGKFERLYEFMDSLYKIKALCDTYPGLQMCVGHSVDLEKENIIVDAKEKIDNYIKTRLEREQQILDAIKTNPEGTAKSAVYDIVYGPRNLNEHLKGAALNQIMHHTEKLEKDGVIEVQKSDDPIYKVVAS